MSELIRAIYTEVWKLHKAYYGVSSDGEWTALLSAAEELTRKYPCEFCRDSVLAMITEIERRYNGKESD